MLIQIIIWSELLKYCKFLILVSINKQIRETFAKYHFIDICKCIDDSSYSCYITAIHLAINIKESGILYLTLPSTITTNCAIVLTSRYSTPKALNTASSALL